MKFDFHETLLNSSEFRDWKKNNSSDYLSHFYSTIDKDFQLTGQWEIGYYNPQNDRITTFTLNPITIKPEEKAFKKEEAIEELKLNSISLDHQEALEIAKTAHQEHYSQEILLNGFLILQTLQQTIWNVSFAAKSTQILNIKIDAANKKVLSSQLINFIESK